MEQETIIKEIPIDPEPPIKIKRNGGKKVEFYSKLLRIIEEMGEWSIPYRKLSEEWKVSIPTIRRWKTEIIDEIGKIDLTKKAENIRLCMESNVRLCQRTIRESNEVRDKMSAVRGFNDTVDTYTRFLESYGYKEKVADKIELNSKQKDLERLQKIVAEVENGNNDTKTL